MATSFAVDPSVLPQIQEKKGSLLLRSNHMKYKRGTLVSCWHEDREALPMDYDVSLSEEKDLRKAAYTRLGNATDGSLKDAHTTTHDVLEEVTKLGPDYETQETHKPMVTYDNFYKIPFDRDTGRPDREYGSVLPRHPLDYRKAHMITTHSVDYKYPFDWTPKDLVEDSGEQVQFHRPRSEFADNDGPKRHGINTFRDFFD